MRRRRCGFAFGGAYLEFCQLGRCELGMLFRLEFKHAEALVEHHVLLKHNTPKLSKAHFPSGLTALPAKTDGGLAVPYTNTHPRKHGTTQRKPTRRV